MPDGPLTASAASRPCQLYAHSVAPVPSRTQGHHRYPVYLQERLWGEVRETELLWLCGTCHDSAHDAIGWMLGETRKPNPMPGYKTLREAKRTVNWYLAACAERGVAPEDLM